MNILYSPDIFRRGIHLLLLTIHNNGDLKLFTLILSYQQYNLFHKTRVSYTKKKNNVCRTTFKNCTKSIKKSKRFSKYIMLVHSMYTHESFNTYIIV